ncbi:uncharacterized protein G2W53_008901 [Senna tora]|uniref:Uncharacterized protein n=1 Tax=Senna tora TaxID=362788 RepID=A0A834WXJ7_9FABA|nr:uncharacterized protein G2W53_008901 [Senna tora]
MHLASCDHEPYLTQWFSRSYREGKDKVGFKRRMIEASRVRILNVQEEHAHKEHLHIEVARIWIQNPQGSSNCTFGLIEVPFFLVFCHRVSFLFRVSAPEGFKRKKAHMQLARKH